MANPQLRITELIGAPEFLQLLRRSGPAALRAGAAVLFREGEGIMRESKKIVPVEFGNLRDTGKVALPTVSADAVEVVLGYGDSAVKYAVYVHENLAARHRPGQYAKFLEFPVLQAIPGMDGRLAVALRAELEKRGT